MKKIEKSKILLIFSEEIADNNTIHEINTRLNIETFKLDYVISPSRSILEIMLFKNKYFFVISFVQYIKSDERTYNLIELLDNLAIEHYGCNYLKCLMVNDTYAFVKTTGLGIPTKIITRYYSHFFENDFLPVRIILTEKSEKYSLIANKKHLQKLIDEIFENNKNIEDLVIQKAFDYDKKISITIIGNSPYLLKCIKIYNTNNMSEHIKENDINTLKMLNKACEIFEYQSFRDYAQFIYEYNSVSGEYYLTNVDVTNLLNEYIVDYFEEHYALSEEYIIYTYILAYLTRLGYSTLLCDAIECILDILPNEIVDSILPLEYKLSRESYNYRDICKEMQKRFLAPDESNKYEISKLLQKALSSNRGSLG